MILDWSYDYYFTNYRGEMISRTTFLNWHTQTHHDTHTNIRPDTHSHIGIFTALTVSHMTTVTHTILHTFTQPQPYTHTHTRTHIYTRVHTQNCPPANGSSWFSGSVCCPGVSPWSRGSVHLHPRLAENPRCQCARRLHLRRLCSGFRRPQPHHRRLPRLYLCQSLQGQLEG